MDKKYIGLIILNIQSLLLYYILTTSFGVPDLHSILNGILFNCTNTFALYCYIILYLGVIILYPPIIVTFIYARISKVYLEEVEKVKLRSEKFNWCYFLYLSLINFLGIFLVYLILRVNFSAKEKQELLDSSAVKNNIKYNLFKENQPVNKNSAIIDKIYNNSESNNEKITNKIEIINLTSPYFSKQITLGIIEMFLTLLISSFKIPIIVLIYEIGIFCLSGKHKGLIFDDTIKIFATIAILSIISQIFINKMEEFAAKFVERFYHSGQFKYDGFGTSVVSCCIFMVIFLSNFNGRIEE